MRLNIVLCGAAFVLAAILFAAGIAISSGLPHHPRLETADAQSGPNGMPIPSEPLVRGQPGDYWADVIIGKPAFSEITPHEVVPFKVFNPGGVAVDRTVDPGRAYVWDAGNSRVLGIDLARCYADEGPCNADIVLGQPSPFDHSACNGDGGVQNFPHRPPATATTLCGLPDVTQSPGEHHVFIGMVTDNAGNLYVPDSFNHRVLFYENPFKTDAVADFVWGQKDFSGFTCNLGDFQTPSAASLCFHSQYTLDRAPARGGWPANGVGLDAVGNLWVADSGNNRVLRFPVDPSTGVGGTEADIVLGQPDFHSNKPGAGLTELFAPAAVRFDPQGRLYVADAYNNRVLVFDPPFSTGMTASRTFGRQFRNPMALEIDPEGLGVWVNDFAAGAITLWDWSGDRMLKVIGKLDGGIAYPSVQGNPEMHHAGGVGIDSRGNVLAISTASYTQDVLRFAAPIPDAGGNTISQPDKRFFYPPAGPHNFMGNKGLHAGMGVATFQDQLIVSDIGRLMFWNGLQDLANGKPADGIIGDVHHRRGWLACCGPIKADGAGRLWVMGAEGSWKFIDVYQLPLTAQSAPLHTIWTRGAGFPVLGTDVELRLGPRLFGIAPTHGGTFLWISDTDNHRVLRIRHPLTNPVVDVILGQNNPDGVECNRGNFHNHANPPPMNMLCFPGNLSVDRLGNLWVSDHALEVSGNFRLLMFQSHLFPAGRSDTIFAPHATKTFFTHGDTGSKLAVGSYEPDSVIKNNHRGPFRAATFEPAFDSLNRMVVGFNMYVGGRFVAVYDDPLGPTTEPSAYLNDLASMPVSATFDRHDNLYIGDHNRARVLVYWNPLNNPLTKDERAAALPEHSATIRAVDPLPPRCILRTGAQSDDGNLFLTVDGLPDSGRLELQIRKIASADLHNVPINGHDAHVSEDTISVGRIWTHLWTEYEKTAMFARVLFDGQPLTSWSTSFIVADDAETCGHSRPAENPVSATKELKTLPPASVPQLGNRSRPTHFMSSLPE